MRERIIQIGTAVVVLFGLFVAGWVLRGMYDNYQWQADRARQAGRNGVSLVPPVAPGCDEDPLDPNNLPPTAVVISNRPRHPNQEKPKYHRLDCQFAKRIKPEYRHYFKTPSAAEAAGFQPCAACNPNPPTTQPE